MSVVWVKAGQLQYEEEDFEIFYPIEACAICGENLWRDDFIYWSGEIKIGLHPSCAEKLGISLLKDVREWELGTVKHYKGRAERTVEKHLD